MNEAIIGRCTILYDGSDPFDSEFPDLSRALEGIFTPGQQFMVGGGDVDLRIYHDLGAEDEIAFEIRKDGKELLTIRLPDLYAVDALRRYCDMTLEHNRLLEARHGPRPE